eukprot:TRINITY_DN5279_c2_g2_i1.p1 TRINITY_DN5279_c2_g2~~TRINITY_DN5279_c2_g2_i1.p1  ORF type:complete len:486 (+),score=112.89 TRINITY_DN5279_c2_g2_i1:67-1524(+)
MAQSGDCPKTPIGGAREECDVDLSFSDIISNASSAAPPPLCQSMRDTPPQAHLPQRREQHEAAPQSAPQDHARATRVRRSPAQRHTLQPQGRTGGPLNAHAVPYTPPGSRRATASPDQLRRTVQPGDRSSVQRRRGSRPASWTPDTPLQVRRRMHRDFAEVTRSVVCSGCGVSIPASQLVGHASQCNRMNVAGDRSSIGAWSSLASCGMVESLRTAQSTQSLGTAGKRESLTSAYSVFIAQELEGANATDDRPTGAGADAATRSRTVKESLLQRMSKATAKWDEMSEGDKAPYHAEAERNRRLDAVAARAAVDRLSEQLSRGAWCGGGSPLAGPSVSPPTAPLPPPAALPGGRGPRGLDFDVASETDSESESGAAPLATQRPATPPSPSYARTLPQVMASADALKVLCAFGALDDDAATDSTDASDSAPPLLQESARDQPLAAHECSQPTCSACTSQQLHPARVSAGGHSSPGANDSRNREAACV